MSPHLNVCLPANKACTGARRRWPFWQRLQPREHVQRVVAETALEKRSTGKLVVATSNDYTSHLLLLLCSSGLRAYFLSLVSMDIVDAVVGHWYFLLGFRTYEKRLDVLDSELFISKFRNVD